MADSRTYLNVPFIEKDSAKALGARWDSANKKWYAPANLDIKPFARWFRDDDIDSELSFTASVPKTRNNNSSASKGAVGGITYPTDKNFVAYNGDEPPWNHPF